MMLLRRWRVAYGGAAVPLSFPRIHTRIYETAHLIHLSFPPPPCSVAVVLERQLRHDCSIVIGLSYTRESVYIYLSIYRSVAPRVAFPPSVALEFDVGASGIQNAEVHETRLARMRKGIIKKKKQRLQPFQPRQNRNEMKEIPARKANR